MRYSSLLKKFMALASRRLKPLTFSQALERVAPREIVAKTLTELSISSISQAPSSVMEIIADELDISFEECISAVAEQLEIGFLNTSLQIPTSSLLACIQYDCFTLKEIDVLPIRSATSPIGAGFAVANPDHLDLLAFSKAFIPIVLCHSKFIKAAWARYDYLTRNISDTLPDSECVKVIGRLVLDANSLGANKVIISSKDQSQYSFSGKDGNFYGSLHPFVFQYLLQLLAETETPVITLPTSRLSGIRLTGEESGHNEIIISLNWPPIPTSNDKHKISYCSSTATSGESSFDLIKPTSCTLILLIDDDSRFTGICRRMLESKGWEVSVCNSAVEAANYLENEAHYQPALVICDIHMPEMDGISFLKKFRSRFAFIPLIILTSDNNSLLEAEAALLGADTFIRKQEDPRILVAWCKNLINRTPRINANVLSANQGSTQPIAKL